MKSSVKIWLQLVRAQFFTASIIPVLIGGLYAALYYTPILWGLFLITLLCALFFHAGTNIVSEYFDYHAGVDKPHTYGSSRVLVEGLLPARKALWAGMLLFLIGFLLGLMLVRIRGLPILYLGILGLLGGYTYTGRPFGFKYKALGDVQVFIFMGVLLVAAPFFVLTGTYYLRVFLVSLPISLLVTAILHANNLRDIHHDKEANIKTLESTLGFKKARWGYFILLPAAYLAVGAMIAAKILPLQVILVSLSLPLAAKNMGLLAKNKSGNAQKIMTLDLMTAQLHLAFGSLFIIGLLLSLASHTHV
ncbi:MAG: 1,4-dihydroxy-2-naphthoate octaprenyltransferase [Candidatus Omnitrophica bacterium]|nr:1,4-dihydroxy-2-naphthoate octaprenyltransferase [Candidatus Omnitrophota bacterium]